MKLLHTLLLYSAVLPQIALSANYYDCRNDKLCFKRSRYNQKAPCSLCNPDTPDSNDVQSECKNKNGNVRNVEGLAPWCDNPRGPFPECPSISSSVLSEGCSDNCQFYNQTFAPGCECTVGCEGERQRTVKCTQELKWNDTNIPDSCPTTADAREPQPSPEHESTDHENTENEITENEITENEITEQPPSGPSLAAGPSVYSDPSPEQGLPTWSVVLLGVSLVLLLTVCIVAVLVKNYLCKRRPNKECSNQPVEDPLLIHPTKPNKKETNDNSSKDCLISKTESIISEESKEADSPRDPVAIKVEETPLKNSPRVLEGELAMGERFGYVINPVVGDGSSRITQLEPRTLQDQELDVVGNGRGPELKASTLLEPYHLQPTEMSRQALSDLLQSRSHIVELNTFLDQKYDVSTATWHNIALDLLKWPPDELSHLDYINRPVESPGQSFTCKVLQGMEKQGYGLLDLIQYLESRPNRNIGAEDLLNKFYMKRMNHYHAAGAGGEFY